jgi:hypothetical protein
MGSINLPLIESYVNNKIEDSDNKINGSNSLLPLDIFNHLNCGVLVLQKTF